MLIMLEVMHMWAQRVYGKSLYSPLKFNVNLKLLYKVFKTFLIKKKIRNYVESRCEREIGPSFSLSPLSKNCLSAAVRAHIPSPLPFTFTHSHSILLPDCPETLNLFYL